MSTEAEVMDKLRANAALFVKKTLRKLAEIYGGGASRHAFKCSFYRWLTIEFAGEAPREDTRDAMFDWAFREHPAAKWLPIKVFRRKIVQHRELLGLPERTFTRETCDLGGRLVYLLEVPAKIHTMFTLLVYGVVGDYRDRHWQHLAWPQLHVHSQAHAEMALGLAAVFDMLKFCQGSIEEASQSEVTWWVKKAAVPRGILCDPSMEWTARDVKHFRLSRPRWGARPDYKEVQFNCWTVRGDQSIPTWCDGPLYRRRVVQPEPRRTDNKKVEPRRQRGRDTRERDRRTAKKQKTSGSATKRARSNIRPSPTPAQGAARNLQEEAGSQTKTSTPKTEEDAIGNLQEEAVCERNTENTKELEKGAAGNLQEEVGCEPEEKEEEKEDKHEMDIEEEEEEERGTSNTNIFNLMRDEPMTHEHKEEEEHMENDKKEDTQLTMDDDGYQDLEIPVEEIEGKILTKQEAVEELVSEKALQGCDYRREEGMLRIKEEDWERLVRGVAAKMIACDDMTVRQKREIEQLKSSAREQRHRVGILEGELQAERLTIAKQERDAEDAALRMEMMRVQLFDQLEQERFEHRRRADEYEDKISELELQVKEYEEKVGKLRRRASEKKRAMMRERRKGRDAAPRAAQVSEGGTRLQELRNPDNTPIDLTEGDGPTDQGQIEVDRSREDKEGTKCSEEDRPIEEREMAMDHPRGDGGGTKCSHEAEPAPTAQIQRPPIQSNTVGSRWAAEVAERRERHGIKMARDTCPE